MGGGFGKAVLGLGRVGLVECLVLGVCRYM